MIGAVMAEPAWVALAEAKVAGAVAAALVHTELLVRLVAIVASHAIHVALTPALVALVLTLFKWSCSWMPSAAKMEDVLSK